MLMVILFLTRNGVLKQNKEWWVGILSLIIKLVDVEFLPVQIMNYGQPYFIENLTEKQKIITEMFEESSKLSIGTKVTQK
ncbi:MAG: hypothetical protein A3J14_04745 [Candidatus Levybacteria bacterium RIFCSPLOWO2_02_FULL_37_18]|nr:MAG: hypothetical protein A3J14_04745 [Candidatus Levybacteria bacterium RIFCSPLOWO2_02_FULL_37_18]